MAGPMPGTNALAHCPVAHLNRQEDLQCWPPRLIINLGVDSEGPRCLPSKFQEISSGIHYFAEVKGSVLVVKETSPGFGVIGFDQLLVAIELHLEEAHASGHLVARVEFHHCPFPLLDDSRP